MGQDAGQPLGNTMSQFPLALSRQTRQTGALTHCRSMHVTLGINTQQTWTIILTIRTMKIATWQSDALLSPDQRA
jgi:hypothetical protein